MGIIQDIISLDPTTITITRHTKVASGGGFTLTDSTLAAQTVRVYNINAHNQREYKIPDGEIKKITHGILAEYDADIVCSHTAYDTFTYKNRTFRVVGVRRYQDVNIDACTQVDCVAV